MVVEAFYQNENGSNFKAPLDISPIKCYFIIIDFDGNKDDDKNRDEIYFKNEDKYGWKGFVANNYQEAEEKLNEAIQINEKPEYLIILSHGGIMRNEINNIKKWQKNNVVFYTNHNNGHYLSTEVLNMEKTLEEIDAKIKKYDDLLNEISERKKARAIRTKINFNQALSDMDFDYLENNADRCNTIIEYSKEKETDEDGIEHIKEDIQIHKIFISEANIKDLKKGKKVKINGYTPEVVDYDIYGESEEQLLDYYYNRKKGEFENTKKHKQGLMTDQVNKDIVSLKNILTTIVEGGTFFLASCHAAWVHDTHCNINECDVKDINEHKLLETNGWKDGLIEQIIRLTPNKINIIAATGTTLLSTTPLGDGKADYNADRNIGLIKTKENIEKEQKMKEKIKNNEPLDMEQDVIIFNTFLDPTYSNNEIIYFPASYNLKNKNRTPSKYKDVKIVKGKLELI